MAMAPNQPPHTAPPPAQIGRVLRVVLIVSLALNLLVAGLAVGAVLNWRAGGGPPRAYDLSVGPLGRALLPEDRRAIARALHNDDAARLLTRAESNAALTVLLAILRAEPFDAPAFAAQLADQRRRSLRGQEVAQALFVARIAAMSPDERAGFAGRLEQHGLPNGGPDGGGPDGARRDDGEMRDDG